MAKKKTRRKKKQAKPKTTVRRAKKTSKRKAKRAVKPVVKVKRLSTSQRRNQERFAIYFREAFTRFASSLPLGTSMVHVIEEKEDGSIDMSMNGIWRER